MNNPPNPACGVDCRDCPAADRCPLSRLLELIESEAPDAGLSVCVIDGDWERIDRTRARARAAGLDDRVSVHHASVLELCRVA